MPWKGHLSKKKNGFEKFWKIMISKNFAIFEVDLLSESSFSQRASTGVKQIDGAPLQGNRSA